MSRLSFFAFPALLAALLIGACVPAVLPVALPAPIGQPAPDLEQVFVPPAGGAAQFAAFAPVEFVEDSAAPVTYPAAQPSLCAGLVAGPRNQARPC